MDYTKIYNSIIERAQNRKLEGYSEKHHITPKCIGGQDVKENIVELTAREHFLCHRLLCEIYPNQEKLWYALWLMAIGKKKWNHRDPYNFTSREYERIKLEFIQRKTGSFTISEQHKNKISKHNSVPVYQYNINGEFVKLWDSCVEAEMYINNVDHWTKCNDNVGACARGERKTAYKFIWSYIELLPDSPLFNPLWKGCEVIQIDADGNTVNEFRSKSSAKSHLKISDCMFYILLNKPFEDTISHKKVKILQLTLDGKVVNSYDSIAQTKENGFNPSAVSRSLNKLSHTSGGYKWEYADEDITIKYRLQWKNK